MLPPLLLLGEIGTRAFAAVTVVRHLEPRGVVTSSAYLVYNTTKRASFDDVEVLIIPNAQNTTSCTPIALDYYRCFAVRGTVYGDIRPFSYYPLHHRLSCRSASICECRIRNMRNTVMPCALSAGGAATHPATCAAGAVCLIRQMGTTCIYTVRLPLKLVYTSTVHKDKLGTEFNELAENLRSYTY